MLLEKTGNLYSEETKPISHTTKNVSKYLTKTLHSESGWKNLNKIVQDIGISKGFLEKTPIAQKLIPRNTGHISFFSFPLCYNK